MPITLGTMTQSAASTKTLLIQARKAAGAMPAIRARFASTMRRGMWWTQPRSSMSFTIEPTQAIDVVPGAVRAAGISRVAPRALARR